MNTRAPTIVKKTDLAPFLGAVALVRPTVRRGIYHFITDKNIQYRGRLGVVFEPSSAEPRYCLYDYEVLEGGILLSNRPGAVYLIGDSNQAILASEIIILFPDDRWSQGE